MSTKTVFLCTDCGDDFKEYPRAKIIIYKC